MWWSLTRFVGSGLILGIGRNTEVVFDSFVSQVVPVDTDFHLGEPFRSTTVLKSDRLTFTVVYHCDRLETTSG